jgi:hypothetical protein
MEGINSIASWLRPVHVSSFGWSNQHQAVDARSSFCFPLQFEACDAEMIALPREAEEEKARERKEHFRFMYRLRDRPILPSTGLDHIDNIRLMGLMAQV